MKIQIDIEDKVKEGDILIYKGGRFIPISTDKFLRNINTNIERIDNRIFNLEEYVKKVENRVTDLEYEVKVLKGEE